MSDLSKPATDSGRSSSSSDSSSPAPLPTIADTSQSMRSSLVGQTFGDFELTHELGRGGMGVVFKAWQKSLERHVALKMLLPEHATNPQILARFLTEARAAGSLAHPNIVSIYQVGQCDFGPYFVMEYIDGKSLQDLLGRTFPFAWSVALMMAITQAVQHAHSKGIIHRDLKPANIMINQSKRPVVMDFGIAKLLGKGSGLTIQGVVVGTPSFMPPEQAGDDLDKIGPHSDVYSLGAILYILLTGRAPFEEDTAFKTILKVVSSEPAVRVRKLRPDVPPALERVCHRCLQKDPAQRYRAAQDLFDDLRRVRALLTQPDRRSTNTPNLPLVALIAFNGKAYRLPASTTVIGRSSECDLTIKQPEISKKHCRIVIGADQITVEDLGSSNGTLVNGKPIARSNLQNGDKLDLGGCEFQVRVTRPRPA
ncbi:MAG: FHA domain-containing protein [Planctomycetia bacterium]|nr:FHA domain-containing protein [Planctomycetia bacterium]